MKPHIPYVYRLTDLETGKRYIGSRYAKVCEPTDLGITYFTSSKTVAPLFRENPERFEKQIIATGTVDYVINVEKSLIDLYGAVLSEDFYNRTNSVAFHPEDSLRGGLIMASRTSARMKSNHPMRDPAKARKHSEWMKINNPAKDVKTREAMSNAGKGKPKSVEHKARIKMSGCGQKGAALNFTTRWKCNECELITFSGPLACHQSAFGHAGKTAY